MGYTTDFEGRFNLDKPLSEAHAEYLRTFSDTRRMKRDASILEGAEDPTRIAVGLPVGDEGGFFVSGTGYAGQDRDRSVKDQNQPPAGQPGLWCQWVPTEDATGIEWDGGEKFYDYVEWLQYIIREFLVRWGYVLNGEVTWQGEESDDFGKIVVINNDVQTKRGKKVYD